MDKLVENELPSLIIQARMGSTRLPGKVAMILEGKPVLVHFIERVKRMKHVDKIIVATTIKDSDTPIVEIIQDYDDEIGLYRGSENDVLDRFYQAAKKHHVEHIIRITPDDPLIDPSVSDLVVRAYLENDCDYCCNNMPPSYPLGLDTEVFSFNSLERAWNETQDKMHREHVTPYIRENPESFRLINVPNDLDLSHMRWTLDHPDDFEFMKEIFSHLYHKNEYFSMADVLSLLDEKAWINDINMNVREG